MARGSLATVASRLTDVSRRFYARGWALGTSGNFSAVVSRQPLRLAITASSVPKGQLRPADILECDDRGVLVRIPDRTRHNNGRDRVARGEAAARRPSAETLLHVEIARVRGAGAILHTHSVWTTMLSDHHASEGGLAVEGYEMLKGLSGVSSHEHREWIPIIPNDQDMPRLAGRVAETLKQFPDAHAFLLRRHGLYTWGDTLAEAERHVEILEFLFETIGRSAQFTIYNPQFTIDKPRQTGD
jgi:methylthioribulose-1-phosphate dehydratase